MAFEDPGTVGDSSELPVIDSVRYSPGHPETLTPDQKSILKQFKEEVDHVEDAVPDPNTDAMLCRFLRARKFNLARSKDMFVEMVRWRQTFGTDEVYASFEYAERDEVFQVYPRYFHKTDKQGRPIYIEEMKNLSMSKLKRITSLDKELKFKVKEYEKLLRERLPACSRAAGRRIETISSIIDLKGVPFGEFWPYREYLKAVSYIGQNYYPETLGQLFIINAPSFFSVVWNIAQSWLDDVTARKIVILGSDYPSELSKYIALDHLPKKLGGGCECPEGCENSNAGLWQEA